MAVPSQVRTDGQETGKVREDEKERYWAAAGEERLESFSRDEALRHDDVWVLRIGHRREVDADRAFREAPADDSVSEP